MKTMSSLSRASEIHDKLTILQHATRLRLCFDHKQKKFSPSFNKILVFLFTLGSPLFFRYKLTMQNSLAAVWRARRTSKKRKKRLNEIIIGMLFLFSGRQISWKTITDGDESRKGRRASFDVSSAHIGSPNKIKTKK